MKKIKRVVVISDLHCAHHVGLTPPEWQNKSGDPFDTLQKEIWKFYTSEIRKLQPINLLVVNGDAIDGKGKKSGGTELITPDIKKQCDMAVECIKVVNAKKVLLVHGTSYHTGEDFDYEDIIAGEIKAQIGGHEFVDVNGLIFDFKHKVGGSSIPHGRGTSIAKEKLLNHAWFTEDIQPNSDVLVRSHVHGFYYVGDGRYLAIKTPAISGYGSKFGVRQCGNIVNIGFVHFDVENKENYTWQPHLLRAEFLKNKPIKL